MNPVRALIVVRAGAADRLIAEAQAAGVEIHIGYERSHTGYPITQTVASLSGPAAAVRGLAMGYGE